MPWHFWEDKSRSTGVPKKSLGQKTAIRGDPISADPICPFPIQIIVITIIITVVVVVVVAVAVAVVVVVVAIVVVVVVVVVVSLFRFLPQLGLAVGDPRVVDGRVDRPVQ